MADNSSFNNLVPGFDFLQGLAKNASVALPAIGQWITPTLDPVELERRIGELRTVQFWLEQNAGMLATTIQALEVQRLTLSTLKTMNVQMEDLRDTLKIRMPGDAAVGATRPAPGTVADSGRSGPTMESGRAAAPAVASAGATQATGARSSAAGPAMVDPMQWWGALTQQFSQLAATAMKDAPDAARGLETGMIKPPQAAANDTLKPASARSGAPAPAAGKAGGRSTKVATSRRAPATGAASKKKSSAPRKRPTR